MLGILKRAFVSSYTDLWKILFTSMIRPRLGYTVQVWNPRSIDDIERLEKVQRRYLIELPLVGTRYRQI